MRRSRSGARALAALLGAVVLLLLAGCGTEPPIPSPSTSSQADSGRVFHVDCRPTGGGAPGGDGSLQHPWSTLDAVNEHGPFTAGERVLLQRGSVCDGRLTPAGSGTNGDPIVLGAYGSGAAPVVNGGGTADGTAAVQLTDQHDWTVQDLEVTNLDPAGPDNALRSGILAVDDGSGALGRIVIRRNTVRAVTSSPVGASADPHEFGGITVLVHGSAPRSGALADIRIEDNLVDHVGRTGIVAWSEAWPSSPLTSVSITGNRVVRADGDGIILWGVDGGVVEHDVSERGGRLPPCQRCSHAPQNTASAGIWPVMSRRILVRYDEVSGEGAAGGDGEGFDVDESTADVVLEGDYAHDDEGGGVLICGASDTDVRDSVFADSGGGEVTFSCPAQRSGVRIVHDTFFLAPGSSAQVVRHTVTTGTDPVLFADDVVLNGDGGGYAWPSPVIAQGDLFAGVLGAGAPGGAPAVADAGLLAPGTEGTGLDSVSGFTPLPGSAAASGGVVVPDDGGLDYFGRSRSDPTGRGAIAGPSTSAALAAVVPTVSRNGDDVTLDWSADGGTGWRLQRSVGGGAFRSISGVLRAGRFLDSGVPQGALRYRLIQIGRDRVGTPSSPVQAP